MRAAGYYWSEIESELGEKAEEGMFTEWVLAEMLLGAKNDCHAIALAIRGGHIL